MQEEFQSECESEGDGGKDCYQEAIKELLGEQERRFERSKEMLETATEDNRKGLEAAVDMLRQSIDTSLTKLKQEGELEERQTEWGYKKQSRLQKHES